MTTTDRIPWIDVIDEMLVTCHLGTASASDSWAVAREKLDKLIAFEIRMATDPAINGGFSLQPVKPTKDSHELG